MSYTGDLSEPGREPLHARLLPEAGRADRRRRRARAGDQGHGRAAARPGRHDAGVGAAQQLRPAGARAHPRHPRRSAGHLPGGLAGRRRARSTAPRRRWRAPPASRRCRRSSPPPRTPSTTPGCRCRRCAISSRTGRRCERCTRRSSPGCPPRPGGCTPTRSPAVSCPTCGSRRSRWASVTGSRRSRPTTPRRTGSWAGWSR